MDTLRFVLLVIGIAVIAIIYFWDAITQRKQQRERTIHQTDTELKLPVFGEEVFSSLEEELPTLSAVSDDSSNALDNDEQGINDIPENDEFRDSEPLGLFTQEGNEAQEKTEADGADNNIIMLHITALPTKPFSGSEFLKAINLVEMEFGEMGIFHHRGIGEMHSTQALFSLSNMYEPGYFDLDKLASEDIKGLTLFLCLPTPVDTQIVFELMLNTTQRLAQELGGEVRGPGHKLLNENTITELRNKLAEFSSH